jgi:trehalose 6-phosphate synthase
MPLTERRLRWEAMMVKLRGGSIQRWFADFVDDLADLRDERDASAPLLSEPPAVWPLRSVNCSSRVH